MLRASGDRKGEGIIGGWARFKRYFYFKSQQYFCLLRMERQDCYQFPEGRGQEANFVSNLLNDCDYGKDLLNVGESTDLKGYIEILEEQMEEELWRTDYKDILKRAQPNCRLPDHLYQEPTEQSLLIINPTSKKDSTEPPLTPRKDIKADKFAYLQETRQAKIERYRQKKQRRRWNRKVFYDCRKVVADNRERMNGRFIKKSPLLMEKKHNHKNSMGTEELELLNDYQQSDQRDPTDFLLE